MTNPRNCVTCTFRSPDKIKCQRYAGGGKKAIDSEGGDSDNATSYTIKFARSKAGPCGPEGSGYRNHERALAQWNRELERLER